MNFEIINGKQWWNKLLKNMLGIIVVVFFTFLIDFLRYMYIENQLDKYGKPSSGKVVKLFTKPFSKYNPDYAVISYSVNDYNYLIEVLNKTERYKLNDELLIMVNQKDPQMIRICH